MRLEDQFTAAMLAAGNKRSSITCYWRHMVGFIRFTSERNGGWIHPEATKIEDVYAWRRYLAKDIHLSPKTQNQAVSAIKFCFRGCWENHSPNQKRIHYELKNRRNVGAASLPNQT